MLIRVANESDVDEIAAVHASALRNVCGQVYDAHLIDAWLAGKTRESYLRALSEHPMFVALCEERVIGFSRLDATTGEISAVYVRSDCLRRGVGGRLLQTLEDVALQRGLTRLSLRATLNAISFYTASGFVLDEMSSFSVGTGASLPCARMHKPLNGGAKGG